MTKNKIISEQQSQIDSLLENKIVYNINSYNIWIKNENIKAPNQRQTCQIANFVSNTG